MHFIGTRHDIIKVNGNHEKNTSKKRNVLFSQFSYPNIFNLFCYYFSFITQSEDKH